MKFIVSAKALWILMEKEKGNYNEDGYCELTIDGKKLHFNGFGELDVESKEDSITRLTKKQFKRLRKVLRALEDQPIVIYSDSSRHIHIQNICF